MQVTYWFIIKGESWTVALCYLVFDLNVGMTLTSDNSMLTWIFGQRLYEIIPYIAKKTVTMYMITLYDRKMSFSLKFSWGFGHITEKVLNGKHVFFEQYFLTYKTRAPFLKGFQNVSSFLCSTVSFSVVHLIQKHDQLIQELLKRDEYLVPC